MLAGILIFVAGIFLMIFFHELGHFLTAKRFGIRVHEFFIGFGPRVWSFRRGETEYGFKAIPLGGYVKLVGMLPPLGDTVDGRERVRSSNTGMFTQLVADARNAEYELVGPDDAQRLFYRKPWWQKLIIMSGGPMMNVLIAPVLFAILIMGI